MSFVDYKYCCTTASQQAAFKNIVQKFIAKLDANRGSAIVNQSQCLQDAIQEIDTNLTLANLAAQFKKDWNAVKTNSAISTENKSRVFFRYFCLIDIKDSATNDGLSTSYDTWKSNIAGTNPEPVKADITNLSNSVTSNQFDVNISSGTVRFMIQGQDIRSPGTLDTDKTKERATWKILEKYATNMINDIINRTGLTPCISNNKPTVVYVKCQPSASCATTSTIPWKNRTDKATNPDVLLKLFPPTNGAKTTTVNNNTEGNLYNISHSYLATIQHELIHVLHFSHLYSPCASKYKWINEGLAESIKGKKYELKNSIADSLTTATKNKIDVSTVWKIESPSTNTDEGTADDSNNATLRQQYTVGWVFFKYVSAFIGAGRSLS